MYFSHLRAEDRVARLPDLSGVLRPFLSVHPFPNPNRGLRRFAYRLVGTVYTTGRLVGALMNSQVYMSLPSGPGPILLF